MVAKMITYTCPTCGKQVRVDRREALATRPFCCQRCKMVDLYKWFNEQYRISDPLATDADGKLNEQSDT